MLEFPICIQRSYQNASFLCSSKAYSTTFLRQSKSKMAQNEIGDAEIFLMIQEIISSYLLMIFLIVQIVARNSGRKRKFQSLSLPYSMLERIPNQVKHLHRILNVSDNDCIVNLRMDRNTFQRLCVLLKDLGGLSDGKYVCVEEQVATFLGVLAHHKKNRIVGFDFIRSGQTISHYLHIVLKAILKLHSILLVKPQAVLEDCDDPRWKWFKGCLGALDGTYINVKVCSSDKPRYRSRKGEISTNTLAVCDRNLRFVYFLPGWEGSASDSRVLRDAVNRVHGLKVPKGNYYLCDNGYPNSEGFLTPYKGVRYHLKEWGPNNSTPQNAEEIFNMRHAKARNIIERAFGIMKMRWGILRSASYYPIKVQNRLIMACFLLHNFIRTQMEVDPIEAMLDDNGNFENNDEEANLETDYIGCVESTNEWNQKRAEIAQAMWDQFV